MRGKQHRHLHTLLYVGPLHFDLSVCLLFSLFFCRVEQTELDGYVAAECVLCGDIMVQSVDNPLVSPEELDQHADEWAL